MAAPPRFSIVIPTRDRPRDLDACLTALAELDYPAERYEVVVVDDGGSVPAEPVVHAYRDRLDVRALRQAHGGPAAARNAGAAAARGEVLAFTDDDCRPPPDWLGALDRRFAESGEDMVGGRAVNVLDSPYAVATQMVVDHLHAYYNRNGDAGFVTTNNLAVLADAFAEMGGFDRGFRLAAGEDREFGARWRAAGRTVVHAPEVVVRHAHRLGPGSFLRQHVNYGRGAYRFRRRRGLGLRPERPSFYLGLVAQRPAPGARGLAVRALLLVSQAATAVGFLREALSARRG